MASRWSREDLTVIYADRQTSGRGRFDRQWVSPAEKNLYASFVFFTPRLEPAAVSVASALAGYNALARCGASSLSLKWPNDIICNAKKIGGILVEAVPIDEQICVVAGLGINILSQKDDFNELQRPATSLLLETGRQWPVEIVLGYLTDSFRQYLHMALEYGYQSLAREYESLLCHQVGDRIAIGNMDGSFLGLSANGGLLLDTGGAVREVTSGEIGIA